MGIIPDRFSFLKVRRWKAIIVVANLGMFYTCHVAVRLLRKPGRATTRITDWHDVGQATIDSLPSIALLGIFGFYLSTYNSSWPTLVHVCRRWRNLVFKSPHRLNVELSCTFGRPARAALGIWPPLPISILGNKYKRNGGDVDNIVAALEHNDRVCKISLWDVSSSELEKYFAVMGEPFLSLTSLELQWDDDEIAKVARGPDSFLGGSAPHLQSLTLSGIPIPFLGLQKLLLSANGLVHLRLRNIPHSVYFSPDDITTVISALTKLQNIELTFQSPRSRPIRENRRPPPTMRTLLPALTYMKFKGISDYLEDIVAQIDAPLLDTLSINFFHQVAFDTRQLAQFIGRAPKLEGRNEARVVFSELTVRATFLLASQVHTGEEDIDLRVPCKHPDLQLSSVTQLCTQSFPQPFVPSVEHLYIVESKQFPKPRWENNIPKAQWLRLLRPFTAVKDLYLSEKMARLIAPALRDLVGERATEVLPALQCLFLEGLHTSGPVMGAIAPFITARQESTYPVVASYWDREEDDWWDEED